MNSIESMRSTLMDKEVGSRLNFLLSRDARLEVESNLGPCPRRLLSITRTASTKPSGSEGFRRGVPQDGLPGSRRDLAKRDSAAEELKKAELRRQLIVLKAPADAIVLEIANRTIGSVVREAETLFVLVPRDVPLQAEINVEGRDIGQVSVGQSVRIKFEAFPFQKYGTGTGAVRVISQDTFSSGCKGRRCAPHDSTLLPRTGRLARHASSAAAGPRPVDSRDGRDCRTESRATQRDVLFPLSVASRVGREHPGILNEVNWFAGFPRTNYTFKNCQARTNGCGGTSPLGRRK